MIVDRKKKNSVESWKKNIEQSEGGAIDFEKAVNSSDRKSP